MIYVLPMGALTLGDRLMALELGMLGWIIFQGELLLRHDRERLRMEREHYRMNTERYDERKKWRNQKQAQQIRKIESATNVTTKHTESVLTLTTSSEKPKAGHVPTAGDPPPTSPSRSK